MYLFGPVDCEIADCRFAIELVVVDAGGDRAEDVEVGAAGVVVAFLAERNALQFVLEPIVG
jgi:hypothetical protein